MLRRLTLLVAALAVVASACGSDSKAVEESNRNEEIPIDLTIEVGGDLQAKVVQSAVKTRFVMISSNQQEMAESLIMGVEPVDHLKDTSKPDGPSLIAGFAVSPFKGDGTYTIPAGSVYDEAKKAQEGKKPRRGSARLEWAPAGNPEAEVYQYLRRQEPCTVKIEEKGTRGSLDCPAMSGEEGTPRFSLAMRWDVP